MANKYGVFQSTSKSCVLYKEDEDGNQSTFNIFVTSDKDRGKILAFIDNEQFDQENWSLSEVGHIKDILQAFDNWALDAPLLFEIEAQKSLSQCLGAVMKKED